MNDVKDGNWNVPPEEIDDPELDAAWAELDPADVETANAELNESFREVAEDRAAVDRLNAGIEENDPQLDPDAESDEARTRADEARRSSRVTRGGMPLLFKASSRCGWRGRCWRRGSAARIRRSRR